MFMVDRTHKNVYGCDEICFRTSCAGEDWLLECPVDHSLPGRPCEGPGPRRARLGGKGIPG